MTNQTGSRPSRIALPDWESAKDIFDSEAGIVVRISKRTMPPSYEGALSVTHFSLRIDHYSKTSKRVLPYFPMMCHAEDGAVKMDDFPFDPLQKLIVEATDWILLQRQAREDEITLNRRIAREEAELQREKGPKAKPGLKTLAKMDAEKRKERESANSVLGTEVEEVSNETEE